MSTLLLALAVVVLLGGTFASWRRHGRVGWGWALPWTLLLAEFALRGVVALQPAPPSADRGLPRPTLDTVAGRSAPAALDARRTDTPTVLFIGDSFTVGDGLAEEDTFVARFAAAHPELRAVNHGREGRSAWDVLALYGAVGVPLGADVVVHTFFPNDFGLDFDDGLRADLVVPDAAEGTTGLKLLDLPLQARRAAEATAHTEAAYLRALTDPARHGALRDRLTEVVDALHARDARFVFVLWPVLHRLQDHPFTEGYAAILDAARAAGSDAVVDLTPVLATAPAQDLWVSVANHHGNARAQGMVLPAITEAVLGEDGVPASGPTDCARTPELWELASAVRAACRAADDPEALLVAAADLAATTPPPGRLHLGPVQRGRVAVDLAVLAAHRGADAARADAVVTRAMAR